ncbi:hypothetical protein Patl1_34601 [Pistacia atlantica]|uniref:Uncharacterized protein n=1 Tax=Pistacia atlantica TaxID=434234 RepID=A0ACC0ZTD4_9ROSI|nr:hypothetical protein Patl1_34601 [Pistacia atlantica]
MLLFHVSSVSMMIK